MKQLFQSPSLEPPLLFLWDVFDMLLMSLGSCVLFHCTEWLSGPGPISCIILLCGLEPLSPAFLPVSPGPGLQCRMKDNPLITGAQNLQDDKAESVTCGCQ